MRELTIGKNDAGQRLDRFLSKALPLLPPALAQKYIRIKRVKVNGGRAQRDQRLSAGDVLQLYINDEFFEKPTEHNAWLKIATPRLDIVYEDDDPEKLAERLAWAIDHPEKLAAMRQASRDQYERPYSKQAFADGLKQAVRELTGESTLSLCQN